VLRAHADDTRAVGWVAGLAAGINRLETGPMMRCTFEETVEILFEAAAFSMPDRCLGLTLHALTAPGDGWGGSPCPVWERIGSV